MADKQEQEESVLGENAQANSKETKPSKGNPKARASKPGAPPNRPFQSALQDESINGIIEIGPMMTVGELTGHKPGDPPIHYKERLVNPTIGELHKYCTDKLSAEKDVDGEENPTPPVFGPERPPEEK